MSEAAIATSVPVPIAMPRSAWASAGASLMPSPTIATILPSALAGQAAPVTTGANPLKGTSLTIIGGNSYVPAQDGLIDAMVKQLSADTGMDAKIERFA